MSTGNPRLLRGQRFWAVAMVGALVAAVVGQGTASNPDANEVLFRIGTLRSLQQGSFGESDVNPFVLIQNHMGLDAVLQDVLSPLGDALLPEGLLPRNLIGLHLWASDVPASEGSYTAVLSIADMRRELTSTLRNRDGLEIPRPSRLEFGPSEILVSGPEVPGAKAYSIAIFRGGVRTGALLSAWSDTFSFEFKGAGLSQGPHILFVRAYNFPYIGDSAQVLDLAEIPVELLASEFQVPVTLR